MVGFIRVVIGFGLVDFIKLYEVRIGFVEWAIMMVILLFLMAFVSFIVLPLQPLPIAFIIILFFHPPPKTAFSHTPQHSLHPH